MTAELEPLQTTLHRTGREWTLDVIGHVNASNSSLMWEVESLGELVRQMRIAEANALIVDLSQTTSVDSHGLRSLIEAHKMFASEQIAITLRKPNDHLARLFRIMQFNRLFEIEL